MWETDGEKRERERGREGGVSISFMEGDTADHREHIDSLINVTTGVHF